MAPCAGRRPARAHRTPPPAVLLAALLAVVPAYSRGSHDLVEETVVNEAAALCASQVEDGASGPAFVACVEKATADSHLKGTFTYQELIRNYSCSQDDMGTLSKRTVSLAVSSGYDACEAVTASPPGLPGVNLTVSHEDFDYMPGTLPAGNDISSRHFRSTLEAAEDCNQNLECAGFTFNSDNPHEPGGNVVFKSIIHGWKFTKGSHTFRKKTPPTCAARFDEELRSFRVDIIREEPLVAMIRNFATKEECDKLVEAGGDWKSMKRAQTQADSDDHARRSYQKGIYPQLQNTEDHLTRLTALMFTVTRNLTGYSVYPPGQEPLNAVLYKKKGDEYRPHCDGACDGRQHSLGERIATSILYCRAATEGGQTTFTEGALKLRPDAGDMLLFGYRDPYGRMAGIEAEHSGCPIRKGRKWIATQWYREGVNELWTWQRADEAKGRSR